MVIKSKKDHQKILNAGFTILRIREVQKAPAPKVYFVWAKTKNKDWHKFFRSGCTVESTLQDYLEEVLKDPFTILEG